jgi:diacylglycerol O-acyltransferase
LARFHHAIADGVRLTQVMLSLGEGGDQIAAAVSRKGPTSSGLGPTQRAKEVASGTAQAVSEGIVGATTAVTRAARSPWHTLRHLPLRIVQSGRQSAETSANWVRHPDRFLDALETFGVRNIRGANDLGALTKLAFTDTAETIWSGEPGTTKVVTWSQPIPLDGIKRIGRALNATVNDVLLAVIAGGLHDYLAEHGGRLDEVNWMVPVNLKPFAENLPEELGNYFALVVLPMTLETAEPAQRVHTMHHRMERIKHSDEAVITFGMQRAIAVSPAQIAYFLTNFFANKAIGVLTNVPGPTGPITFAGQQVEQVVGFAPCSGDQAMTATIFSYNGGVTVGFATDAELIPDPDSLVDNVMHQMQALRDSVLDNPSQR